jgi:hypothetical protein
MGDVAPTEELTLLVPGVHRRTCTCLNEPRDG